MQAAVGSHCLDCAKAAQPDVRTRARYWNARQPAMVTMAIMALNALVFIYVTVRDPQSLGGRNITIGHAQLGLNSNALGDGMGVRLPDGSVYLSDGGDWYRLLTSGFLHFGIIHIAFNMYLLYVLGQMLEPAIGRIRFLLVYLAGLLGGSAGSLLIDGGGIAGGASGAVFGLMALAFVGYYLQGANPLNTQIGTLLMLNLFITFVIPGISVGGHLGGAAAGALCALVVMAPRHRGYPRWAGYATPAAVAVLALAVSVASVA
ncbi:MAG: rhomboid family intramembrane serine protease [Ilumatobacter sp.]|uniref:rhomboid family intramembrane serine protease n=1 Tax=Ilumatobacter sp. TaxID=1967498 RepID=UPI002636E73E|nr:rhomboid family intramembrane serine protease [Ilumatobacter sp.]MDJ0768442.1 rhomboid family intramembrane serine protease [Ilumatobacter sp.]